jgi:hypothetical protein
LGMSAPPVTIKAIECAIGSPPLHARALFTVQALLTLLHLKPRAGGLLRRS